LSIISCVRIFYTQKYYLDKHENTLFISILNDKPLYSDEIVKGVKLLFSNHLISTLAKTP